MARYLWQVSYTVDGAKGVIAEGGSSRESTVATLVEAMGGKLELFAFALGDDDAYVVAELPDDTDAAAVSLAVAAGGGARIGTTPLLTPAQVDTAARKVPAYRPPGG